MISDLCVKPDMFSRLIRCRRCSGATLACRKSKTIFLKAMDAEQLGGRKKFPPAVEKRVNELYVTWHDPQPCLELDFWHLEPPRATDPRPGSVLVQ